MKKYISLLLVLMVVVSTVSGCKSQIDNTSYAQRYDRIMYKLAFALDQHFYPNLKGFFDLDDYGSTYSHQDQRYYLEELVNALDDVLYELDQIGYRTDDKTIQVYQSNIEYALKDIKSEAADFLKMDLIQETFPNKNTLYREVYFFMTEINDDILQFVESDRLLDLYLEPYRGGTTIKGLAEMKEKNHLRYTFTYLATATYIAPMADFTGLAVDPNRPWWLWSQNVLVYEMAFSMIVSFRDFYSASEQLPHGLPFVVGDGKVDQFRQRLEEGMAWYEGYYEVRKAYPHDFYQSDAFRAYQEEYGTARQGYFYDFSETYGDLVTMKEAYLALREMLYDEELWRLMY